GLVRARINFGGAQSGSSSGTYTGFMPGIFDLTNGNALSSWRFVAGSQVAAIQPPSTYAGRSIFEMVAPAVVTSGGTQTALVAGNEYVWIPTFRPAALSTTGAACYLDNSGQTFVIEIVDVGTTAP
ncbi:MAG TPA: hypothetical protein VME46_23965, partial [Acidimicrobiales bacterium]|nr:hypothetical protein [Acidimicrobiales bacterium]